MTTIKDVAREAGVTPATVSYVLNNTGRVSEATRQRVMAAARRLNYRPSIIAQNLRAGESRIIGYAWHRGIPGDWTPVMQEFLYSISESAEREGYHILTFIADSDDPVASYLTLADTGRVDAFVLAYTVQDDPRVRRLLDLGIPFVSFGRANDQWDFPFVDVDGENGMAQITNHLLACGHQRIALVTWPKSSLTGEYRQQGYLRSLEQAGIEINPQWITTAKNIAHDGYLAAQRLMELPAPIRPTAIACVSDMIAIGVMQFLNEAGYVVGRDIAVTGFDDIPMADHLNPPLTSVRQPLDLVGEQMIALLLSILRGERLDRYQILIKPTLMIRASSDSSRTS